MNRTYGPHVARQPLLGPRARVWQIVGGRRWSLCLWTGVSQSPLTPAQKEVVDRLVATSKPVITHPERAL